MKEKLARFEGQQVEASRLKVSGEIVERVGQLGYGETVYFVGVGQVRPIAHRDLHGAFTRDHTLRATEIVIVERKDGERMLTESAMLADERFGVPTLFNEGDPPADEP